MHAITYSDARANFAAVIDRVNADRAPVLITRQGGKPAVLLSLEDFEALDETAYLMRNPNNAAALGDALGRLNSGKAVEVDLATLNP